MIAKLEKSDPHHWHPIPQITDWLSARLPADAKVLEIGPGSIHFPRATTFVDFVDENQSVPKDKIIKCDVSCEPLPFADKSFDFVFCRHMVEDMANPFLVCAEMSRVAKAGYVETPSPLAELCRGIDGDSPPYRGYHHHRFIVWAHDGVLRFVSKYPIVEYLQIDDAALVKSLKSGPRYWNTYHLWDGALAVKHHQSPLDFDIVGEYPKLLNDAIPHSVKSTDAFCALIQQQPEFQPAQRSAHGA